MDQPVGQLGRILVLLITQDPRPHLKSQRGGVTSPKDYLVINMTPTAIVKMIDFDHVNVFMGDADRSPRIAGTK
jgi:hypothetical protein